MGKVKARPKPFGEKLKEVRGVDVERIARKFKHVPSWLVYLTAAFFKGKFLLFFAAFESGCEWISYLLSLWAFLEVLEYLGKLSLLVALIVWIYPGCRERQEAAESAKQAAADARKSRHYVAWQTINSALGKPGNAGRVDALQDLNQDRIPLDGISLSGDAVLIGPLNLTNASMTHADFSDGVYEKVNFSGAKLEMSKWDNARSEYCDFRGASFWGVTFKNTSFVFCDFGYADKWATQTNCDFILQSGSSEVNRFVICNFVGAEFPLGSLNSFSFQDCNFENANFGHLLIGKDAGIFCCNLFGATTASPEFIIWVRHQLVTFTNVLSLEGWYNCVTNRTVVFRNGGPEFMEWASNNFTKYINTNSPQAWLDWSKENLKN